MVKRVEEKEEKTRRKGKDARSQPKNRLRPARLPPRQEPMHPNHLYPPLLTFPLTPSPPVVLRVAPAPRHIIVRMIQMLDLDQVLLFITLKRGGGREERGEGVGEEGGDFGAVEDGAEGVVEDEDDYPEI